jgi:biofilm PGA synthesis N-glycosyltransferase PgaC
MTKYVIISPVRDESKYIEGTIDSVVSQTVRAVEWIIVNDGSSDNTGAIIESYARKYPWIRSRHRENRGFRMAGTGVVEAFDEGYRQLSNDDWDFIVKLDGDLTFDADYFEKCFEQFLLDPLLGIGGGVVLNKIDGKLKPEKHPLFHVRGATKIYRKKCWQAIGGLINAPGWDTLDEAKANMKGWKTMSFLDFKIIHHRATGAADGAWKNWVKNGRANYISGYHPVFMAIKCVKRFFQKPYIIGSAGLMYGFVSGYMNDIPQVKDEDLIKYIRKEQMNRLLFKESMWK